MNCDLFISSFLSFLLNAHKKRPIKHLFTSHVSCLMQRCTHLLDKSLHLMKYNFSKHNQKYEVFLYFLLIFKIQQVGEIELPTGPVLARWPYV